jgi:hypothetical protein
MSPTMFGGPSLSVWSWCWLGSSSVVLAVERGRQTIKVSLSASVRQLSCMLYSSSRVRGSEAVASWISYSSVNMFGFLVDCRVTYWVFHPFVVLRYVP